MGGFFSGFFGDTGPKSRVHIRIRGHVYEGNYHVYMQNKIREHALKGWMRILHLPIDSYLEMDLEGPQDKLKQLLVDCQHGPPDAKMFAAEIQWKTFRNEFHDFRLRT